MNHHIAFMSSDNFTTQYFIDKPQAMMGVILNDINGNRISETFVFLGEDSRRKIHQGVTSGCKHFELYTMML